MPDLQAYHQYLARFVDESDLRKGFFSDDTALKDIAGRAPAILNRFDQWNKQSRMLTGPKAGDHKLELLKLALYDIHIFIDDSGSMRRGDGFSTAHGATQALLKLRDIFSSTNSCAIHVLNGTSPSDHVHSWKDGEEQWKNFKPGGRSMLGTRLEQQLWSKIIGSGDFVRPRLVYIITDGESSGELEDQLQRSMRACGDKLRSSGRNPAAIAWQVIQTGIELVFRSLLQDLVDDPALKNHTDVVMEKPDIENAFRKERGQAAQDEDTLVTRNVVGALQLVHT